MPTPKKAPEDRTGHHGPPTELAEQAPGFVVPRPPMGLSAKLKRTWEAIWTSPMATLLDPGSDLPVVSRLFYLYKLSDRVAEQIDMADPREFARLARITDRTFEDDVLMAEVAAALKEFTTLVATQVRVATEVRQLEQTIGISPQARLRLGVALAAGKAGGIDDAIRGAGGDDDY